jgi:gliding motility associated protien GldN
MKKLFVILSFIGLGLLFVPEVSAQSLFEEDTTVKDGLYDENETGVKAPMPLPYVREADVMWKKTIWREIDFRQKMNQGFYFPTTSHKNLKNLYTILKEALQDPTSGVIAYKDESITGELIKPTAWSEIKTQITGTTRVERTDDYGNVISVDYVESEMNSAEVKRCQIKEEWYFDKQRSELLVKIIAICPIRMVEKDGTQVPQRLFWVPYDENLRKVLIDAPFFNRSNSANRLSYDDVFMRRVFDSYIIREDNIFDRSINEYAKGAAALHESERVKQSIIDFEQNLWEY